MLYKAVIKQLRLSSHKKAKWIVQMLNKTYKLWLHLGTIAAVALIIGIVQFVKPGCVEVGILVTAYLFPIPLQIFFLFKKVPVHWQSTCF